MMTAALLPNTAPQAVPSAAKPGRVVPQPGETQPAFAVRFHRLMADRIPQTDARNAAMWAAWCEHRGEHRGEDRLDRLARERFGQTHDRKPFLPLFDEHVAKNRDGSVSTYNLAALRAIVSRCNHRILDSGDFAPLIDGHTPDEKGTQQPDVLGWVGPFRLGMIGNLEPRWAIFADEWHDRGEADRLRKLLRRSPEVWLEPDMRDRFFDPVAALGAETPRRDLGIARFSRARSSDGRLVEKYAAVFPGGANTLVPAAGKRRYAAGTQPSKGHDMPNPQLSELAQEVVNALRQTDEWAFLQELKSQHESPGADEKDEDEDASAPDPEAAMHDEPDGDEPIDAGDDPEAADLRAKHHGYKKSAMRGKWGNSDDHYEYAADRDGTKTIDDDAPGAPSDAPPAAPAADYKPDGEDRDMVRRYVAGECSDDEMHRYLAGKRNRHAGTAGRATYSRDGQPDRGTRGDPAMTPEKYAKLERENKALVSRVAALEAGRTKAERYSRLQELAAEDIALDVDEELDRCAPEKMTAEQFEAHCEVIREHYARVPTARTVPMVPVAKSKRGASTVDEEVLVQRAIKYAREKNVGYAEALAHVEQAAAQTA